VVIELKLTYYDTFSAKVTRGISNFGEDFELGPHFRRIKLRPTLSGRLKISVTVMSPVCTTALRVMSPA
jgi:hypothetical protein